MTIIFKPRRAQQYHETHWMSLPIDWCRTHDIAQGSLMEVRLDKDGKTLLVTPKEGES